MRIGIIGMGNMGSKYALMIAKGTIEGMELVAVTRVRPERWEPVKVYVDDDFPIYQSGDELFAAVDCGEIELDAVLVVTPHYSHEQYVIEALKRGLSVLCDKPAGVYSRQGRNMLEAYEKAKETNPNLLYGFIFHQRTYPVYKTIKEIIDSKKYGKVKRVSWVITDWYRTNAYYEADSWRGTWAYDGGGILLNQCPHNLDLITWMLGVPESVMGFCTEGKYHNIEVEDDATFYMNWNDGATGVFTSSTGEATNINRLEISFENALLVCDKENVKIYELEEAESVYLNSTPDNPKKPVGIWKEVDIAQNSRKYEDVLEGFVRGELVATGYEAMDSLYMSNAVYLSSWTGRKIDLPKYHSDYEKEFEEEFERYLNFRRG